MSENKNWSDGIINFLNNFENGFVNVLAKIVPILVPMIPAYVSYQHVIKELQFHPFFAWTYAIVVEGLGYASVYKALQFYEWNKHYKKDENKSPFWLAVGIYVTYIVVILWVNVMLDWQIGVVWYKVVAVGAISLLSVPAGLLVSISAIHTERVREKDDLKAQLKEGRERAKAERDLANGKIKKDSELTINEQHWFSGDWRKIEPTLTEDQWRWLANLEPDEMENLSRESGVTYKTVSNRRKTARNKLGIGDDTSPLQIFIEQSGRFPNADEIRDMKVSPQEVVEFVATNGEYLVENGLIEQDMVRVARERLSE